MNNPFGDKITLYKPKWGTVNGEIWDNGKSQCNVCDTILLRHLGWYVYMPNPKSYVKNYFVCSQECGEMFILQRC